MSGEFMTDLDGGISIPPALELDAEKYLPEFDDFDMTEAQKRELLETLWSIMRTFVEFGFSANTCERMLENVLAPPNGAAEGVPSSDQEEGA